MASTLFLLHVMRRLYECLYVTVPSDSTMNLGHYAMGFAHYFCAGLVLIMEAPLFAKGGVATLSRYVKYSGHRIMNGTMYVQGVPCPRGPGLG